MTAPPPKQKVVNCQQKKRHPDEFTARAAGMYALETFGQRDGRRQLWVYQCPLCRGWHLTKKDQGAALRVTKDNPVPD